MSIPGQDLLSQIENSNEVSTLAVKLGQYFRRYVNKAIDTTAKNAGVSASTQIAAPQKPESISVSTSGEMMQVVVNHTAPTQKGIQYITHISTNPQFTNAIVHDHGCSRSPAPFQLPTKDSSGATHNYYVATIAQLQGSHPSLPTYWGGESPAPINMTGTTQMDIQPGTGSGTAVNGGQTLVGIGKAQVRLAQGAKRNVNS